MMPVPAVINTRTDKRGHSRTMWECPNCYRPLGEIVGNRIVVMLPRGIWSIALQPGMIATCWKCHTQSTMDDYAMLEPTEYRSTVAQ